MRLRATNQAVDGSLVENAAFVFYTIAATGSSIGQIWVGVVIPPWPTTLPWWARAVLVAPFAVVLDLGGVVTAAFADWRQRLGERAYGWRALSTAWIGVGVAINVIGHADSPYLSAVFGALGSFAYSVWLLHAAARRRDALRAAGKLDDTAPAYGIGQWRREPQVTARARLLALEHGYSRLESLRRARQQLRDERRDRALQQHITQQIKAHQKDPILAAIAATTAPVDALAAELTRGFDVAGWATYLAAHLRPPIPPATAVLAREACGSGADTVPPISQPARSVDSAATNTQLEYHEAGPEHGQALGEKANQANTEDADGGAWDRLAVPTTRAGYERWRELWRDLSRLSTHDLSEYARRNKVSVRTLQRIRQAGEAGQLDEPIAPGRGHLLLTGTGERE
jgi:hypothetical protein